jgi:succinoglycan biosynthesis transport protein ExoP
MLQNSSSRPSERQTRVFEALSPREFYAASIGFLRRRLSAITFALLLSLVLGAIYIFATPPRYIARATLVVDVPKTQFFQSQWPLGAQPIDSATVDTQIQILNSEDLALSIIKDLHLNEDPDFISPREGVLGTVTTFASDAITGAFKKLFSNVPVAFGQPPPDDRALHTFQSRLRVKRLALTYAIEISFESATPFRAAQIANAIADAYEVDAFKAKYEVTGRAANWLQSRLKELREQVADSERGVVDYKSKNKIVDSGGRPMNEQQLAELNTALIQARAAAAEAGARLDHVQQIVASGEVDPQSMATATVADTLHNDVINKMRGLYLEDERRASELTRKYGAQHIAVADLRHEMRDLQHTIFEELKRTAESYKSDYAIAKAREKSIQQSLDLIVAQSHTTDVAQITLNTLKSSALTYRDLYDNFLQRHMESEQEQSSPVSGSRLITHARPPLSNSWPKPLLVMALATLGGLIFGTAIGMLRDISDRAFRTTVQVCEHLQADCLAVIPLVRMADEPAVSLQKAKPGNSVLPATGVQTLIAPPNGRRRRRRRRRNHNNSICWTVANSPFSRFSESIRALRVATDSGNVVRTGKTVGITSSLPNEGKSTVALSLAAVIAQGGGRAILVDCDLRNPALTNMLTPDAKIGLLQIIAGKAELEDVLWREPVTGLVFLPAALTSRVANSSDLLASQQIRHLFRQLRDSYDYVIIDLSPLAPVVDVRVVTPMIDSFLFVVEWGRTKIDIAQLALSSAGDLRARLLGIVLNKADMKAFGRYTPYHHNYYTNPYYARYGYTD